MQTIFAPAQGSRDHSDASIMLVDDSPTSRMLLDAILRGAGFSRVSMAKSGDEALTLLRQRIEKGQTPPADIVLMDINMPGLDGIETVRRLKEHAELQDIPVIMVTVSDERDSLEQAFQAGAIDYINKPVNKLELLARVRTVLKFREEMGRRRANEQGLMDVTASLSEAYKKLEEMNQNLETRVKERTAELEKAYEELKELDRMKTAFLSNVSHELRTPMTSVLGFANIIRSRLQKVLLPEIREPGSQKRELLDKAVNQVEKNLEILTLEARRLTMRINDVLDVTRMESGEMDWNDGPVQLEQVLERAKELSAPLFWEKNIEFSMRVHGPLPEIRGDRERLLQAMMNLIGNAAKFTSHGSVELSAERKKDEILVCVADTGPGFPDSEYATVFEKFRQIGDHLDSKPQGVGLGVPICSYIIEHHGGRFWATSGENRGATFCFTLPVPSAPAGS